MSDLNQKTWPEYREPTVCEWVDWFESHDRGGREAIAALVIKFSRESSHCFTVHGGVRGFSL